MKDQKQWLHEVAARRTRGKQLADSNVGDGADQSLGEECGGHMTAGVEMTAEDEQPAGDDQILIAEENLGFRSADAYVDWLTTYGVDRNDERLRALTVRLRQVDGQEQPQKLYYLPISVVSQITGLEPADLAEVRPRRAVFASSGVNTPIELPPSMAEVPSAGSEAQEMREDDVGEEIDPAAVDAAETTAAESDASETYAADIHTSANGTTEIDPNHVASIEFAIADVDPDGITTMARWVETVVTPWTRQYRTLAKDGARLDQVRMWNRIEGLRRLVETLCSAEDLAWLERSLHRQGVPIEEPTFSPQSAQTEPEHPEDIVIDLRDPSSHDAHLVESHQVESHQVEVEDATCEEAGPVEADEPGRWGIKGPPRSKRRRLFH